MILWTGLPGMNNGGPAAWSPFGGANNADYKFVAAEGLRHGIKVHLGADMHGYYGTPGPPHPLPFNPAFTGGQKDWLFDDTYWNGTILVGAHTLGRWTKENGYAGVFFDEEISSSNDGWVYSGHNAVFPGHTQAQCEAAATARGKSWMQALVAEFPGIEYTNYSASIWPTGWSNFWRTTYTNVPAYTPSLQNFFYKGALSAVGYSHAWFFNADFYGGQYHDTATHTYTYAGKTYDAWQWGSVQFDRDQTHKYWDTFLDPATDRTKVDIVPFIAIAQIETGQSQAYATKPFTMVNEQINPSITQNVHPGPPYVGGDNHAVPLFGHYAYGNQADMTIGHNPDGTVKTNPGFDYSPYRTPLRTMTAVTTTTHTVDVTISDGVSSVTVPVTIQ